MTERLPALLSRLFEARPLLKYIPPLDREPEQRRGPTLSGVSEYLQALKEHDLDYVPKETSAERKKRERKEKQEKIDAEIKTALEKWDPHKDTNIDGDPYKTLFIGRLSYEADDKVVLKAFERYGPIRKVRVVREKEGDKSRGYAFIEYEDERDMKDAFKDADGMKLLERRIVVDVERGRTVKDWRPKRLGGGLGQTRVGRPEENQSFSGRDPAIGGGYKPPEESTRTGSYAGRSSYTSHSTHNGHGSHGSHGSYSRSGYGGRSGYSDRNWDSHRDRDHGDRYRSRDRSPRRDHRDRDRDRDYGRGRTYEDRDRGRDRDHGRSDHRDRDRSYRH